MNKKSNIVKQQQVVVIPPTKSVVAEKCFDMAMRKVNSDIEISQKEIDQWSERFGKDPFYSLEWSANLIEQVARNRAAKEVLRYLEMIRKNLDDEYSAPSNEKVLRITRDEVYTEVMRKAKWPEKSTSAIHNLAHMELNAKRAEWLEKLDQLLSRIEEAVN